MRLWRREVPGMHGWQRVPWETKIVDKKMKNTKYLFVSWSLWDKKNHSLKNLKNHGLKILGPWGWFKLFYKPTLSSCPVLGKNLKNRFFFQFLLIFLPFFTILWKYYLGKNYIDTFYIHRYNHLFFLYKKTERVVVSVKYSKSDTKFTNLMQNL